MAPENNRDPPPNGTLLAGLAVLFATGAGVFLTAAQGQSAWSIIGILSLLYLFGAPVLSLMLAFRVEFLARAAAPAAGKTLSRFYVPRLPEILFVTFVVLVSIIVSAAICLRHSPDHEPDNSGATQQQPFSPTPTPPPTAMVTPDPTAPTPSSPTPTATPMEGPVVAVHKAQPGDILGSIAEKYRHAFPDVPDIECLGAAEIAAANTGRPDEPLYPGDPLLIPRPSCQPGVGAQPPPEEDLSTQWLTRLENTVAAYLNRPSSDTAAAFAQVGRGEAQDRLSEIAGMWIPLVLRPFACVGFHVESHHFWVGDPDGLDLWLLATFMYVPFDYVDPGGPRIQRVALRVRTMFTGEGLIATQILQEDFGELRGPYSTVYVCK